MLGLIGAVILLVTWPMWASSQDRVALVIGNSTYQNGPDLTNPQNDARAVGRALHDIGFRVFATENVAYAAMSRVLIGFSEKIKDARIVVVYFAGHGVQVDGVTYLMPTDAVMRTKEDLMTAFTLNEVLDLIRREPRAGIVLVDACRDNPIYHSGRTRSFATRPSTIRRVNIEPPLGMLIGYASQPGGAALDGDHGHSPFAAALLKHIPTPDLDVELMLRRVRNEVVQTTAGEQVPWTQSSLLGPVSLNPAPVPEPQQPPQEDEAIARLRAALCARLEPPLPASCEMPATGEVFD